MDGYKSEFNGRKSVQRCNGASIIRLLTLLLIYSHCVVLKSISGKQRNRAKRGKTHDFLCSLCLLDGAACVRLGCNQSESCILSPTQSI